MDSQDTRPRPEPEPMTEVIYCFRGRTETLGDVFGEEDLTYGEMMERLWKFIRKHKLLRYRDL